MPTCNTFCTQAAILLLMKRELSKVCLENVWNILSHFFATQVCAWMTQLLLSRTKKDKYNKFCVKTLENTNKTVRVCVNLLKTAWLAIWPLEDIAFDLASNIKLSSNWHRPRQLQNLIRYSYAQSMLYFCLFMM